MLLSNLNVRPVAYWSYEQAFATKHVVKMEMDTELDRVHRAFSKVFDIKMPDNKVTFKCELNNHPNEFCFVTFSDNKFYLGLDVRPYRGDVLPEPKLSRW